LILKTFIKNVFISRSRYIAWHAVHDPLEVPSEYSSRFEGTIQDESRRVLAGMIANLDEGVANITAALRERGMWEQTITIVTTDKYAHAHVSSSST
jgi:arylsulfatase A-like enzyme